MWNKNVCHKRPCLSRPCPNHLYLQRFVPKSTGMYSVFASLCNILHKDVEQERLSQASMPFATMPKSPLCTALCAQKHWYVQRFRLFVHNKLHEDVEQERLSQESMPFATMPKSPLFTALCAQNAGVYSVFASLYNILNKDVEQEHLSQASMPFATTPKTPLFTAL